MALTSLTKELQWHRMKSNRCPKCNDFIKAVSIGFECTNEKCDFKCSASKFDQIINNLYRNPKRKEFLPDEENNFNRFSDDASQYDIGVDLAIDEPDKTVSNPF